MQLIGPGVAMYDPASGEAGAKGSREERRIGVEEVLAYFGVPPEKVIDVQALAGDSTDNVPGARGIGVKTAAQLINEYGDLDTLLARAGEIKQPKRRETLTDPDSVALIKTVEAAGLAGSRRAGRDAARRSRASRRRTARRSSPSSRRWNSRRSRNAPPRPMASTPATIEPDPAFVGPAGWRGRNGDALPAPAEPPKPRQPRRATPRRRPARNARYGEPAPQKTIATGPRRTRRRARRRRARGTIRRQATRRSRVSNELDAWIAEALRPASSRSTPRPPRSIRCRPISSAFRSASRRAAPATFRSRHRGEGARRSVRRRRSSARPIAGRRGARPAEAAARRRPTC